jgi:glycyl-tRNA synthetase beta chain
VRIEEKRDGTSYDAPPNRNLLVQGEERRWPPPSTGPRPRRRWRSRRKTSRPPCAPSPSCAEPIDHFFDHVTVNAEDPSFRENRLKLLNRIRAATLTVADFSRIEG